LADCSRAEFLCFSASEECDPFLSTVGVYAHAEQSFIEFDAEFGYVLYRLSDIEIAEYCRSLLLYYGHRRKDYKNMIWFHIIQNVFVKKPGFLRFVPIFFSAARN